MVKFEKIKRLAEESRFDSLGHGVYSSEILDLGKIKVLGQGTAKDTCGCSYTKKGRDVQPREIEEILNSGVFKASLPNGKKVSLFKTLFTNYCTHQCNYCSNAVNCLKKSKVYSYTPLELAKLTIFLYKEGYIHGLFLSSGIGRDEDTTMEKMLETVRLLREKYGFKGYIHLKILPGSSREYIKEGMELANRVSLNIEAPTKLYMDELSPTKNYPNDILLRQRYIKEIAKKMKKPTSQTTQLVVGAGGESDKTIFKRVLREYKEIEVKRVYYSAFVPLQGTGFERRAKQPQWREHRLYQLDWLYRVYNFKEKELIHVFDENGFLPNADPKLALARSVLSEPLDPNEASYKELIRVPGIGPTSAKRILLIRKKEKIRKKEQIAKLGVVIKRASPFLKIGGWCETTLERWWR